MEQKLSLIVERFRQAVAVMVGSEHGDPHRVVLYTVQRFVPGYIHAGSSRAGTTTSNQEALSNKMLYNGD